MSHAQDMTDAIRMATKIISDLRYELARLETVKKAAVEMRDGVAQVVVDEACHGGQADEPWVCGTCAMCRINSLLRDFDAAMEGKA